MLLHQATNTRKRATIENMTAMTIRNQLEKITINQQLIQTTEKIGYESIEYGMNSYDDKKSYGQDVYEPAADYVMEDDKKYNSYEPPTADYTDKNSYEPPTADYTDKNSYEPPTADYTDENSDEPPTADYTDKNSYEPPTADYTDKNSYEPPTADSTDKNSYEPPTADYVMENNKKYNSYEPEHIEYNNEYNPSDYR